MSGIKIGVEAKTEDAKRNLDNLNKSIKNVGTTAEKSSSNVGGLIKTFALVTTAALGLAAIRKVTSEYTNLENRIANVTGRTKQLIEVQGRLLRISEETRTSYADTVEIFTSFGRALRNTGTSMQRIAAVTKTVQQSIAVSGTSASSAQKALIQLGQGLSSGVLRGEELNSVMEQTPRLAQAISDELGVSIGKMRLLAAEGKLTSDVIFRALGTQAAKINKEFSILAPTLEQSTGLIASNLKIFTAELLKGLGLTANLATSQLKLAKAIGVSAKNAYDLGRAIAFAYNRIFSNVLVIIKPIFNSIKGLFQQLSQALPKFFFTKTLKGDFTRALIFLDNFVLNGFVQWWKRFRFRTLFTWETDIEKAIRRLRALSPTNWIGAGFNVATMQRLFSVQTIREFGRALRDLSVAILDNGNTIAAILDRVSINVNFFFRSISRYLGFSTDTIFTLKRGSVEAFINSITQIIRGASNTSISILNLAKIFRSKFYPAIDGLVEAVVDAGPKVVSGFVALVKGSITVVGNLFKFLSIIVKEGFSNSFDVDIQGAIKRTFSGLGSLLNKLTAYGIGNSEITTSFLKRTIADIKSTSKELISVAINSIKEFGKQVINVFKDIYDKVIGNSYWTDTIENIIDSSGSLWNRASRGILSFKKNFIGAFKEIFEKNRFGVEMKELNLGRQTIRVPTIKSNNVTDALIAGVTKLKEVVVNLFQSFPDVMRVALAAIGAGLVALLFPAGAIKVYLISALLAAVATGGTLIAEQFGAKLTGGSFAYELGYSLGIAAGNFASKIINDIPKILNALFGLISAFTRGFLEQLPLIGTAAKAIFNSASFLGIAGPLGVIGAFFFGKSALTTLRYFGIFKKSTKDVSNTMKTIGRLLSGNAKGLGVIGEFFFGKSGLGATRTLAGAGIVLDLFGAFDSAFAKSGLAHLIARGGLAYLMIAGDQGLINIKEFVYNKVIAPMVLAVKKVGGNLLKGTSIGDLIFGGGQTNAFPAKLSELIKGTLQGIGKKISELAAPLVSKGYDFLKLLLLGTKPADTIAKFKASLTAMKTFAITQIGRIFAFVKSTGVGQRLAESFSEVRARFFSKAAISTGGQADLFGGVEKAAIASSVRLQAIAGPTGLLGRLFYGKLGRIGLIAGILGLYTLMTSTANASTGDPTKSPLSIMLEQIVEFAKENPVKSIFITLVAGITAYIAGAFAVLLLKLAFTRAKLVDTLVSMAALVEGVGSKTFALLRSLRKFGVFLLGGAIGAVVADVASDAPGAELIGFAIAASIAETVFKVLPFGMRRAVLQAITFSFTGIASLVARAVGLIFTSTFGLIGAAVLAVGALGIWLFGETGQFWTDVKLAGIAIAKLFGYKPKVVSPLTGFNTQQEGFLRNQSLSANFDLRQIDKKLGASEKEALKERAEEAQNLIDEGFKANLSDDFDSNTKAALQASLDRYARLVDNLTISSQFKPENFAADLQELDEIGRGTNIQSILNGISQGFLDIGFSATETLAEWRLAFAENDAQAVELAKNLEKVRKARDDAFKNKFPLSGADQSVVGLVASTQNLNEGPAELEQGFKDALRQYTKLKAEIINAKLDVTLFYNADSTIKRLTPEVQASLDRIAKFVKLKIQFDIEDKAILKFQGELAAADAAFQDLNIDFDPKKFIAADDQIFGKIQILKTEALKLKAERPGSAGELTRQAADINILQSQLDLFAKQAERRTKNTTEAIRELYEQVTGSVIPTDVVNDLSALSKQRLLRQLEGAETEQFRQSLPILSSRNTFGDTFSQKSLLNFSNFLPPLQKGLYNVKISLREAANEITTLGGAAERAASLGVDLESAIINLGAGPAIAAIKTLGTATDELNTAIENNAQSSAKSAALRKKNLLEDLNEVPNDINEVINSLNNLGFAFTASNFALFSNEDISRLKQASSLIRGAEKGLKRTSTGFSVNSLKAYNAQLEKARVLASEAFAKQTRNTPLESLKSAGLAKYRDILNTTEEEQKELLDTIIELNDLELQIKINPGKLDELVGSLADAELKLENLKDALEGRSFGAQFDRVNETLEAGFTNLDFAQLDSNTRDNFDDTSRFIKSELKSIGETGKGVWYKSAEDFYIAYKNVLKKFKINSIFKDVSNALADSFTGSVRDSFEAIKGIIEDFSLDFESFSSLSSGKQLTIEADARMLEALRQISELRDTPDAAQKEIARLADPSVAISEVFDSVNDIMNGGLQDLLDTFKPPMEKLATSVDRLNDSITKLTDVASGRVTSPVAITSSTAPFEMETIEVVAKRLGDAASESISQSMPAAISAISARGGVIDQGAASSPATANQRIKALLNRTGVDINAGQLNQASAGSVAEFEAKLNALDKLRINLVDALKTGVQIDITRAQTDFDAAMNGIEDFINSRLRDFNEQMKVAGEVLSSDVRTSMKDGLKGVLKGDLSFGEAAESVLDTFTNGIIDNFVEGLAQKFIPDGGGVDQGLSGIGGAVFGLFGGPGKAGQGNDGSILDPTTGAMASPVASAGGGLMGALLGTSAEESPAVSIGAAIRDSCFGTTQAVKEGTGVAQEGFGGLGGLLGSLSSSLGGLFSGGGGGGATGLASLIGTGLGMLFGSTGGKVVGAGTGTSDSIPAMLSKGEYVINASATRQNLKLLSAINSGQVNRFAMGGQVGVLQTPNTMSSRAMPSSRNEQVFNLNITGDVSRQTRAEVVRMIPTIAGGVNLQNKERGYKG